VLTGRLPMGQTRLSDCLERVERVMRLGPAGVRIMLLGTTPVAGCWPDAWRGGRRSRQHGYCVRLSSCRDGAPRVSNEY
jgi:hypothetical protein